jgi:hypothetical protein
MMQPGRELDALVAERVMGWTDFWRRGEHILYGYPPVERSMGIDAERHPVPHYSTDITAAWELVEKFRLTVTPWSTQGWIATVEPGEGWYSPADTAPHAICLAALFIVGNRPAPGAIDATPEET